VIDDVAQAYQSLARRGLVLESQLNGIDHVELERGERHRGRPALLVFLLKPPPEPAYGLPDHLERITIEGGVRVTGLRVDRATFVPRRRGQPEEAHLRVLLDRPGDRSVYTIDIDVPELDPCFRRATFSFNGNGTAPVDCQPPALPPAAPRHTLLDYMAKDYASFRQVLLDLVPRLNPQWVERGAADLGIALVELLAYTGDQLSYLQDAVANEAFLDRVRLRISARRHTRLLDYRMHDGRNAWTWVCFTVQGAGTVPQGTRLLTASEGSDSGVVVGGVSPDTLQNDPTVGSAVVFETAHELVVDPLNNRIRIHDWGRPGSWLPVGATSAFVYAVDASGHAARPTLSSGDWLLFEELAGPAVDADPTHRQVVRLTAVQPRDVAGRPLQDEIFSDRLVDGRPQGARCPGAHGGGPLPLLMVTWGAPDALTMPFPLSAPADSIALCPEPAAGQPTPTTVARGNVVAADHGLTTSVALGRPDAPLPFGPLTMQCPPGDQPGSARHDLSCDVRGAVPALAVRVGDEADVWRPVPDLLESGPFDRVFVAEVDDDGIAHLRFGDGVSGERPRSQTGLQVTWRVGNGGAGNVGAEAIRHLVVDDDTQPWLTGLSLRNPLEARGGVDPETVEEVRSRAPLTAATQTRAVTEADYAAAARSVPGVAAAAASFHWTGSWYTVLTGIQPADQRDLVPGDAGRWLLAPGLAAAVADRLGRLRMAGFDLEIRPPRYVGLDVSLIVRVERGHFEEDVSDAVAAALRDPFAQPGRFTFGSPVVLSILVAAAAAVEGVDSVTPTWFGRFDQPDANQLVAGVIVMATFDIARLESDPGRPELGVLRLTTEGGKA
jgi:Baseplate J-like protein